MKSHKWNSELTGTRRVRLFISAQVLLLIIFSGCVRASAQQTDAAPVKREVLALYDGSREREPSDTRIHLLAEMVLNYLGYSVVYRDVRDSLPPSKELKHFATVLTWFDKPPAGRLRYLTWAADAARAGARVCDPGGNRRRRWGWLSCAGRLAYGHF